nr:histone deacetylase [Nocardiopsis ansamitocini]
MSSDRLGCYIEGGMPPGGTRANPGCRDRAAPRDSRAVWLSGGVYFALRSPMWGGGLAVYDPALPGAAPARAHLVTTAQFSDIAAQEMYREPGTDLDLSTVLSRGRHQLGEGRYETLLRLGVLEGHPVLGFTAPWPMARVETVAPSAAYLRTIGTGLSAAHDWGTGRIGAYLANRPGARGAWTPEQVAALLA